MLISQREEEESLHRDAESRLAAEQATRADEDARLRELYPLPEDEEDFQNEELSNIDSNEIESESDFESSEIDSNIDTDDTEEESDIDETIEDTVTAKDKIITEEEGTR